MTVNQKDDPFAHADFQTKAALMMARRIANEHPDGRHDEHDLWFHAQAFGSAFTSVMDSLDNVAKRHSRIVGYVVENWKNFNRKDYYDVAATIRNKMQHAGHMPTLKSQWVDEVDHKNDTTHRVLKFYFVEIKRVGEPAEALTLGEWAVYIFSWWQDQIDQLRRLQPRNAAVHEWAEGMLGREIKLKNINEAKKARGGAAQGSSDVEK